MCKTIIRWIVRRTLSYNLVAIMKAATALIVVSSPSIITPSPSIMYRNEDWYALQYNLGIVQFVVIEYFLRIFME